jgi:hypothetical protein
MERIECAKEWNTVLFLRGMIRKKHFDVRGWLEGLFSFSVTKKTQKNKKRKKNQNGLA